MKRFLIYTNIDKDTDLEMTKKVCNLLENEGIEPIVLQRPIAEGRGREELPAAISLAICLGGDGTMLRAAEELREENIPLIGVNLGTLGYLTEIDPCGIENAVRRLARGDWHECPRMMLDGIIRFQNGEYADGCSLNDIVLSRCGGLQILRFDVLVNGRFLHQYSADGFLITTPTGSTGYNLSAGGPIVEPGARLLTLTPICSHSLNQRSIILSPDDCVEICIPATREGRNQVLEVSFDGCTRVQMKTGDSLRVTASERITKIASLEQTGFLEILNRKMREE